MDKRETILNAAMDLFAQKGFEGTSVREIAAQAQVNPAMISYYFESKEKMLEQLIEHKTSYLRGIFEGLINNPSLTQMEKMEVVIESYVDRMSGSPRFSHIIHRELSLEKRERLKEGISGVLLKNFYAATSIIETGIQSGEFNEVDAELTMVTLIGAVNYLFSSETMCRKILHKGKDFNPYKSKMLKERLSTHLKLLMRSHLLKKPEQKK
ncbi:MAG TPA: TetR family transcriptional regulator [Candidatus Babeliaceae bacterium]|nr:TetR family transcriptional regulator [Candidatus Babeliaceae bacterium]HVZ96856.1 TetR family transcriptional regulator [Chitinophagaceae bacterium]